MRSPLRRVVTPLQEFVSTEVFSASILLAAAATALLWANSQWDDEYFELLNEHIVIDAGIFRIDETVQHWINDCLMTLFFFVVGLEIKRELFRGELQGLRRAALPALAALGGMVAPALIYTAVNLGGEGDRGWGIPMATDIAFALGVLALVGSRIPSALRVFLLALAIADDLGAIIVIAVFYTEDLQADSLLIAVGIVLAIFVLRHLGVRSLFPYFLLGGALWVAIFESGVHATIAGVILGLMTPLAVGQPSRLLQVVPGLLDRLGALSPGADTEEDEAVISELAAEVEQAEEPLDRLERTFHPIASYFVVPLFAWANAGVSLEPGSIDDALTSSVGLGIILGLVIGKPVGILTFSWVAVRSGIAGLPEGATWGQLAAVSVLAGIGFTVALFINELAFNSPELLDHGKIGILTASLVSAVAGLASLILVTRNRSEPPAPVSE
jgi:Na+:H+ antiporter, NhaA family